MIFYVQGRMTHPPQGVDHGNQAAMFVPIIFRGVDPAFHKWYLTQIEIHRVFLDVAKGVNRR